MIAADLKIAAVYYALAIAAVAFGIVLVVIRSIDRSLAKDGHDLYVATIGKEPHCPTCPFKKRCPYSDGILCRFAAQTGLQHKQEGLTCLK